MKSVLTAGSLKVSIKLDVENRLCEVTLPKEIPDGIEPGHLREILDQLSRYELSDEHTGPFLKKARAALCSIPWGSALTYRELAAAAGSPKAVRAAGQACATNRHVLIVPCHRVVAETGLGGFGPGLAWKTKLLELEAAQ